MLLSEAYVVMAGLVPAIHALAFRTKDVDARDKPAHDANTNGRNQLYMM
jgi:hypothetical protein